MVIFIIGSIVKSGECCYFIQKDDINACTFKGRVLEFKLFENDKYIWSGDYVSDLDKVNGNLCIEFNEIIKYISKKLLIQTLSIFYALHESNNKNLAIWTKFVHFSTTEIHKQNIFYNFCYLIRVEHKKC